MFAINFKDHATYVVFEHPYRAISNAIFGGGIRKISSIVNHTLQNNEHPELSEMETFCKKVAKSNGCDPQKCAVLLTAVPQIIRGISSDGRCIVTAGLKNATSLMPDIVWDERDSSYAYNPGTINCIHIVPETLSTEGLIDAFAIAKLSIADTMRKWGETYHKCSDLVGTPTDGIVIACPQESRALRFTSLGTKTGADIAKRTQEALLGAMSHRYPEFATPLLREFVVRPNFLSGTPL